MPRPLSFLLLGTFLLLPGRLPAQDLPELVVVSPLVGDEVDSMERVHYNLFPGVKGFKNAVFHQLGDTVYAADLTIRKGVVEEQRRISLSVREFDYIRDYVNSYDEMVASETARRRFEQRWNLQLDQLQLQSSSGPALPRAPAQPRRAFRGFGVIVGGTFSSRTYVGIDLSRDYGTFWPLAGAFAEWRESCLLLRAGLEYDRRAYRRYGSEQIEFAAHALSLPVTWQPSVTVFHIPIVGSIGLRENILLNCFGDSHAQLSAQYFHRFNTSAELGIGTMVRVAGLVFNPEIRYSPDLSPRYDDPQWYYGWFGPYRISVSTASLQFRVAVGFRIPNR